MESTHHQVKGKRDRPTWTRYMDSVGREFSLPTPYHMLTRNSTGHVTQPCTHASLRSCALSCHKRRLGDAIYDNITGLSDSQ
ncbi:hypothetical protein TNCV_1316471 [Trichonephila clavipes]|nr:hypothetical protein TNCV_1316471 [Trichonephila clavipes]